jgi:hypothetical protein
VKLIRSAHNKFVFQLGQRDKLLLLRVLKLYPQNHSENPSLSKSGNLPGHEANQKLLQEALAEQRTENKKHLETLLTDPRRFADNELGSRLTLSRPDLEWLLQVLNDIRVGSWVLLGSPENSVENLTAAQAPHLWAMELSGYFQMRFLEALGM